MQYVSAPLRSQHCFLGAIYAGSNKTIIQTADCRHYCSSCSLPQGRFLGSRISPEVSKPQILISSH